jgi:hypothetical protein
MRRALATLLSAVLFTAVLSIASAGPAYAGSSTGPCADAYQIGSTGYIYYEKAIAASVKQYYSPRCRQNWGYVWVWENFRDRDIPYDVGVAVYSYTTGQQYGNQYYRNTRRAGFWSGAANTRTHCTSGYGFMLIDNEVSAEGYSSKRC